MTFQTLYLDAGHTSTDPGAVHGALQEHRIARDIVAQAAVLIAEQGIEVVITPDDLPFGAVQRWVLQQGRPGALVAVHCNAATPPGSYGLLGYGSASGQGRALAWDLGSALDTLDPRYGLDRWRRLPLPTPGWDRAWNCIKVVTESPDPVCANLVEVGFLNQPRHAPLYTDEGRFAVARCLAAGCVMWAKK